ncbi:MAG: response regulator [Sphingobium phenoxybenzoativorans]
MGQLNILCVDDEEVIRDIATFALQLDRGISVSTASNSCSALTLLTAPQTVFHAILLDVHLCEESGVLLLEDIRALPQHRTTPVIVLTGNIWSERVAQCRRLGALDAIAKPFDPMTLATDVRRLIMASGAGAGAERWGGVA